jgi:uncharacterized protein with GYD domain
VTNAQHRAKAVLAKIAGKMERAWLSFGEYDVVGKPVGS